MSCAAPAERCVRCGESRAAWRKLRGVELGPGRQSPVDGGFAVVFQVLVGAGEVPAAVESAARQRRGMGRPEDEIALAVDQLSLRLRVVAPEHEDQVLALAVE